MGAFICQISEPDWQVSREVGVYGNREGSERSGELEYFKDKEKGSQTILSIIEDLIGMRKGDIVFFHVIGTEEGESSIHGVYRVKEEPFYNDSVRLWKSNLRLIYPYRFCFEPDPQHEELCKYDGSLLVSEFYRAIENREIRSILTLEREVMGAAHAVKTITSEDSKEIEKLLYRDFSFRHLERPVVFKPVKMTAVPLRNYIERIGQIEFAIKALVSYHLAKRTPEMVQLIPACKGGEYDFLIESFMGQTMRRPTDILCISTGGSEQKLTIMEAKRDLSELVDLVQSLKYWELFKLRNIDKGSLTYSMSICLLAQRFREDLVNYASVRNSVEPWEQIVLLRYTPTENGRDAVFATHTLVDPTLLMGPETFTKIDVNRLRSQMASSPNAAYTMLGKEIPPKTTIEAELLEDNVSIFRKFYLENGKRIFLDEILIYVIHKACNLKDFAEFLQQLRKEANKFQGDFMALEPIIIAESYDQLVTFFVREHNAYETAARHRPISAYLISK